jgi:hypothetical protein
MFVTPLTLIDRTIEHLETLTELLADEVDERLRNELKPEGKLCKEALLTISVLLPKLKAVRCTPVAMTPDYRSACPSCED